MVDRRFLFCSVPVAHGLILAPYICPTCGDDTFKTGPCDGCRPGDGARAKDGGAGGTER